MCKVFKDESEFNQLKRKNEVGLAKSCREIRGDHKRHICHKCRKEKSVKEFVIYGSKYKPKLTKVCKRCNDYRRFENERRKRGEFKEKYY